MKENNIEKFMIGYGFSKVDINYIKNKLIKYYKCQSISKNLKYNLVYLSYLFESQEIIDLTKRCINLCSINIELLSSRIIKLINLNYTMEDIKHIIQRFPNILTYSNKKIDDKLYFLKSYGYKDEDIYKMTIINPGIFSYNIETLNDKLKLLNNYFSKEEIIIITVNFPSIFASRIDLLTNKLNLILKIGIKDEILRRHKNLMQSSELIYARYMHMKSLNIELTNQNSRILFFEEKKYSDRYNQTNKSLIKKYKFEKK